MARNYSFSGRINASYKCLYSCTFEDSLICDKAAVCNKGLQFAIDDRLSHMKKFGGIDATIDQIDSFFAHVDVYSPLYGGRMAGTVRGRGHLANMSEENIKWLNDRGIGIKLTLTNPHFNIEKYAKTRDLLDKYHYAPNMVLTTSNEFAELLRKDYPNYKVEASVINSFDTVEKLNEIWDLYDTIVLPIICNGRPDGSLMIEGIDNLKHPEKIRLFINVECSYTCPKKLCYPKIGLTNEVLGAEHDPIQAFIQGGAAALTQKGEGQEWFVEGQKQTTMDHACSAYLGLDRIFHQDEIEWEKFYFPLERFQQFGINKWKVLLPDISQGRWQLMHKDFYEQFA